MMDRMNLGRSGWGIMIGWAVWVVILPLVIEILEFSLDDSYCKALFLFIYYYLTYIVLVKI